MEEWQRKSKRKGREDSPSFTSPSLALLSPPFFFLAKFSFTGTGRRETGFNKEGGIDKGA